MTVSALRAFVIRLARVASLWVATVRSHRPRAEVLRNAVRKRRARSSARLLFGAKSALRGEEAPGEPMDRRRRLRKGRVEPIGVAGRRRWLDHRGYRARHRLSLITALERLDLDGARHSQAALRLRVSPDARTDCRFIAFGVLSVIGASCLGSGRRPKPATFRPARGGKESGVCPVCERRLELGYANRLPVHRAADKPSND